MKRFITVLTMIFIAIMLVIMPFAGASTIILTAVNDSFLSLSTDTMPTKKSGEWYVPYTVFEELSISAYSKDDGDTLVMQNLIRTVTFSVSEGYTYDQNFNTLSQPAYSINNTIYLPVKLMCGQFGLSFSVLSAENTIIRICDSSAVLTDQEFLNQSIKQADDMVDEHKQEVTGKVEVPKQDPNAPEPIPPEKEIEPAAVRPNLIYLCFVGAPNEYSNDLLETLDNYDKKATFFLPISESWDISFVNSAVTKGHQIGWYIDTADETYNMLLSANKRLFDITGQVTRVIAIAPELNIYTNIDEIKNNGYQVWDLIVQAEDTIYSANRAAELVLKAFDGTTANTVLALHHEKSTNATLTLILRDLRVNSVKTMEITAADVPIVT